MPPGKRYPRKADFMNVTIEQLWSAAGVLAGFQVTAFTLRVNREITVGGMGDLTWLPVADLINVISLGSTLLGVFILPVLGLVTTSFAGKAFGLAAVLLAGYAITLVGHYEMFNPKTPRTFLYFPRQEQIAAAATVAAATAYIVLAAVRR
jgi:hypothetical protein